MSLKKSGPKPPRGISRLIPKVAASALAFQQTLPYARPSTDAKGFSGPMVSLIPVEARRQSKKGSFDATQEPRSPKVSCMGRVHKCKKSRNDKAPAPPPPPPPPPPLPRASPMKKQVSLIRRMMSLGIPKAARGRGSSASLEDAAVGEGPPPSSLGQMKRFSSSRDALASFDWTTARVAPAAPDHSRGYYSDEEEEARSSDGEGRCDSEGVPFSAPIVVGGRVAAEPRKEVNLWKRRTMAPPEPLQLSAI